MSTWKPRLFVFPAPYAKVALAGPPASWCRARAGGEKGGTWNKTWRHIQLLTVRNRTRFPIARGTCGRLPFAGKGMSLSRSTAERLSFPDS